MNYMYIQTGIKKEFVRSGVTRKGKLSVFVEEW
jgi:hypothetical protein